MGTIVSGYYIPTLDDFDPLRVVDRRVGATREFQLRPRHPEHARPGEAVQGRDLARDIRAIQRAERDIAQEWWERIQALARVMESRRLQEATAEIVADVRKIERACTEHYDTVDLALSRIEQALGLG